MTTPRTDERAAWWRQAAVYQVYPRSFADGSGDGIGDFAGVLSRLDHLVTLGIDAVWLSPFYPSALADGGYDVDDYRDVDPVIGTLAEFDELVSALHSHGVKVVIDLVPNHCSDRHAWFRAAVAAGPGSPERARFHFRDGAGAGGDEPPNDWQAMFGGPAWTRVVEPDGRPGQWYLHLFSTHQPDWNWDHADVRDDFLTTLRFWGDRGVDGFRVDVAMGLAKDLSEPYPTWAEMGGFPLLGLGADSPYADGRHPLVDRDELSEVYAAWREVFDTYDPPLFAVAEAWVDPHRLGRYANPDALGQAFGFELLSTPWSAEALRAVVSESLGRAAEHGSTSTWVLSNHDVVRHATRLAPAGCAARETGLARAEAATLMMLALPGSAYLYQGEELGLPEVVDLAPADVQDPWAVIEDGVVVWGRDGCRVPLPWTATGPSLGFGAADAHLPQPAWFADHAVAVQERDPASTLALYRSALRLRRALRGDNESLAWLDLGPQAVAFRRAGGWTSITNVDGDPLRLPAGRVLLRSDRRADDAPLDAAATAWLQS